MTCKLLMKFAGLAAFTLLPAMACSYSASSPVVGAGGGNIAIQIQTQPGCSWQVTSSAAWLEIYSARSGSGSGYVYVYVTPDKGAARASYINVVAPVMTCGPSFGTRSSTCNTSMQATARATVTEY